jgi:hypothetical protein
MDLYLPSGGQMVQIGLRGMQRNKGNEFKGCKLGQSRSGGAQLANQVGLGGFDFETLLTGRVFWNRAFGCKGHAQADDHKLGSDPDLRQLERFRRTLFAMENLA